MSTWVHLSVHPCWSGIWIELERDICYVIDCASIIDEPTGNLRIDIIRISGLGYLLDIHGKNFGVFEVIDSEELIVTDFSHVQVAQMDLTITNWRRLKISYPSISPEPHWWEKCLASWPDIEESEIRISFLIGIKACISLTGSGEEAEDVSRHEWHVVQVKGHKSFLKVYLSWSLVVSKAHYSHSEEVVDLV